MAEATVQAPQAPQEGGPQANEKGAGAEKTE